MVALHRNMHMPLLSLPVAEPWVTTSLMPTSHFRNNVSTIQCVPLQLARRRPCRLQPTFTKSLQISSDRNPMMHPMLIPNLIQKTGNISCTINVIHTSTTICLLPPSCLERHPSLENTGIADNIFGSSIALPQTDTTSSYSSVQHQQLHGTEECRLQGQRE